MAKLRLTVLLWQFVFAITLVGCSRGPKVDYSEVEPTPSRTVDLPEFVLESCSKRALESVEVKTGQIVRFAGVVKQDSTKTHDGCVVTVSVRKFIRKRDTSFVQKTNVVSFHDSESAEYGMTLKMPSKRGSYDLVVRSSPSGCEELVGTIRVR